VLTDDVLNQRVTLTITDVGSALTWVGGASGDWDISNPLNLTWKNTFSGLASFYKEDAVGNDTARFDDTATGTTTVNLTTTLSPNGVTVHNTNLNYTLSGSGRLSGTNGLLKSGPGTLLLDNSGTNDFSGGLTINAGIVQVGNGDANGSLGTGSVANNGAVVFARADNVTVNNAISGSGTITQNGPGILTLSGGSFTGATVVAQGTLKAGTASALGTVDTGTTINSAATLDVNGQNFGAESVTVSGSGVDGNGAIINTGAQQLNAFRFVTLAGDTTLGGPGNFLAAGNPGRWDIRLANGSASLLTGGMGHSLTKAGSNQIALVGVTVDPALGDITIKGGLLGFETSTTSMGDPFARLTVEPGASLSFFNSTALWDKNFILNGNGVNPSITNWSGSNTIIGPIFLNGNCVIGVAGTALICNGVLSGPGSLIKSGNSPLTLAAASDYTGTTTVSNGTLFITGNLLGGGEVFVHGGTLAGVGVIGSAITIGPGGNLAPGTPANSINTIEAGGAVTLAGTNTMDVNKSGGLLANDAIVFAPSIAFGGTLRLTITGEPLAVGDMFRLYEFESASGAFANIVPATPGPGLVWDLTRLSVDGTLVVAVPPQPGIASITVSGTEIVIQGTNGTAGGTYQVLTSPDVALPLASWTSVLTNLFDASGNFSATNAVDPNEPQRFFLIRLP
jgi:fibronectin-binding autotransporter adhesin